MTFRKRVNGGRPIEITEEEAVMLFLSGAEYGMDACTRTKNCDRCDGKGIRTYHVREDK